MSTTFYLLVIRINFVERSLNFLSDNTYIEFEFWLILAILFHIILRQDTLNVEFRKDCGASYVLVLSK